LPAARPWVADPALPLWLSEVNRYRAMAGLGAVTENAEFNAGCAQHARYAVVNQHLGHSETPNTPLYTPEGEACARVANLAYWNTPVTDVSYVRDWVQAPFHLAGLMRPGLRSVSYGRFDDPARSSGFVSSAALDVLRGLGEASASPYAFPAQGAVTDVLAFRAETPDPLAVCPGFALPVGAPIVLSLGRGRGQRTPQVLLSVAGQRVEVCIITQTSAQGGAMLDIAQGEGLTVILPRVPLAPASTVEVVSSEDGAEYRWTFSTR